MLQSLREGSRSGLAYLLFGVIIIVFVFMFGLPSTDSCATKTSKVVAQVYDYKIYNEDLRANVIRGFPDIKDGFRINQQVARNNMVAILVLAKQAEDAGLRVSDADIRDYIIDWEMGNPDAMQFMRNGKFNEDAYQSFLSYTGISSEHYERFKRRELLAKNYLTLIENGITASTFEAREAYKLDNMSVEADYIRFSQEQLSAFFKPVEDAEAQNYAQQNPAKVKAYYDEHIADYTTPATVSLEEITISRDPANETVGQKTDRSLKPEERFTIAKLAVTKDGLDFAKGIENYNESQTSKRNDVRINILAEDYKNAVNTSNINDIITVQLPKRYIIAKITDKKAEVVKPLDELNVSIARKIIEDNRNTQKAKALYAQINQEHAQNIALDKILANIYKDYPEAKAEPQIVEPKPFVGPQLGDGSIVAANGSVKLPDGTIVDANGQIVKQEPTVVVDDRHVIPADKRATVQKTGPFNPLKGYIPGLGIDKDFVKQIVATIDNNQPWLITDLQDTKVAIMITAFPKFDEEAFKKVKEQYIERLRAQKIYDTLGLWREIIKPSRLTPEQLLAQNYGPWIRAQIDEATAKGRIRLVKLAPATKEVSADTNPEQ